MATNLTMPRLSDTMEVGTIVKWHIKPGSKVKSGDVIADIETDKATMELQTFEDGTVSELAIKEGQPTPVGTTILRWDGGTDGPGAKGAKPASATEAKPEAAAHAGTNGHAHGNGTVSGTGIGPGGERIFASPLARKIAADSGIGLAGITGTGPSGRITRRDVEAVLASGGAALAVTAAPPAYAPASYAPAASAPVAAPAPKSAPTPAPLMVPVASGLRRQTIALSNMRRTIAARLVESKTTIPHYQVTVAVRVDALLALRSQLNEQLASQGVKLSVNDFIVRACALSMHQHPFVNARWIGTKGQEAIEIIDQVNVGVAISLPPEKGGGLVVATLRQADAKGLRQLSTETKALADKARSKGLTIDEMGDSTFTISNLGMFGVEHFTAIINPPNAAILAVGGAVKKPVVETKNGVDSIVVGHEMQMTLSSDHRIIDGAMAAEYLSTVRQYLEKPATLLV